jgi:hypothetical protein
MQQLPAEWSQGNPWIHHTEATKISGRRRTRPDTISLPATGRHHPRTLPLKPSAARPKLLEAKGEGVWEAAHPSEGKEVRGDEIAGVVLEGINLKGGGLELQELVFLEVVS